MIVGALIEEQKESLSADEPVDEVASLLEKQSLNELTDWLKSPFWKVCMLILDIQIKMNECDILIGGIADRAKAAIAEGEVRPLYMSDESLRGGIIAMKEMQGFPELLIQELEMARDSKQKNRSADNVD